MSKSGGIFVGIVIGLILGYFAGREHLKYEMRSAFSSAAESFTETLSGENSRTSERVSSEKPESSNAEEKEYAESSLELYDVSAEYVTSVLDGEVPGVLFKIRNNGDRSLDKVEVTFYFKNDQGNIIAEEDYNPVLVTDYSFRDNNDPLKPGYIWQMEKGKFYSAKHVPSEWKEGSVEAAITEIRFSGDEE